MATETPGAIGTFTTSPPAPPSTPGPAILLETICCDGNGGGEAPAVPDAPVLTAHTCAPPAFTIGSPPWPEAPGIWDRVELFRDDLAQGVSQAPVASLTSASDTFTDTDVVTLRPYTYRARACNGSACSALGPPLVAELRSANTITFVGIAEGDTLHDLQQIVVQVSGPLALDASTPVTLSYAGTPLAGVKRAPGNTKQFYATVPATLEAWQGQVKLRAVVLDAGGCSNEVEITVNVNHTLRSEVAFGDFVFVGTGLAR